MTTPYDDLPADVRRLNHGWFGEPWWSYACYDEHGRLIEEMRKPFPAGESCLYCDEAFDEAAGDSGQAMPLFTLGGASIRHVHKECLLRNVVGSLAHLQGNCRCSGGKESDGPEVTYREDALAAWAWVQEHGARAC